MRKQSQQMPVMRTGMPDMKIRSDQLATIEPITPHQEDAWKGWREGDHLALTGTAGTHLPLPLPFLPPFWPFPSPLPSFAESFFHAKSEAFARQ